MASAMREVKRVAMDDMRRMYSRKTGWKLGRSSAEGH